MKHLYHCFSAWLLGIREARRSLTTNAGAYAPEYDSGRELFHRLTFRHFEP